MDETNPTTQPTKEKEPVVPMAAYDNVVDYVDNKMLFEGKSLSQWRSLLILPAIPDYLDSDGLVKLNQRAVALTETCFTNLSIAKARYTAAKAAYNKKLNLQKDMIRESYDKKPPMDVIETKAINKCLGEATAATIAEFFWDFWKNQVEKINTFNDRLTGLNITINQETKILNNKF